ncbi:hypothetical protein HY994_00230 [Candidatus Micrarchaeota archaeon]|nr:hypothetical protein [Candidatus Micrarchaeota archaeon]
MSYPAFFKEVQNESFSGLDSPKLVDAPHCKGGQALHFKPDFVVRFWLFRHKRNIREAQLDDHARGADCYHVMNYSEVPLVDQVFTKLFEKRAAKMDDSLDALSGTGSGVPGRMQRMLVEPGLSWHERTPNGIAGIRYSDAYTASPVQIRKYRAFRALRSAEDLDIWRIHELAEKHDVLVDVMPRLYKDERGKERLVIAVEPVEPPKFKK